MASKRPTIEDIVALKFELETHYAAWRSQMLEDERFYNLDKQVFASDTPDAFDQVRPPSATTIIDLTADHAAGNFPQLHVPRRRETDKAQDQSTLMEKAGQGFWYRTIANSPRNVLRSWAQSGALRGAIAGHLLYDPDAWDPLPLPSDFGGIESAEYKEALAEVRAQRQSSWPFRLDYDDPLYILPDPATEGQTFVIVAFKRKVFDVLRSWPNWDRTLPGSPEPLKLTDSVEFISYWDQTYYAYIVAGATAATSKALLGGTGVQKHGYGFLPYFFASGGFGSPFGRPEHKYRGFLTNINDLLKAEAIGATHVRALVAQMAFPWITVAHGVEPNMKLMGVTYAPPGVNVKDAVHIERPVVPLQEVLQEQQYLRAAIQRATIPDSLGAEPNKSEESGYLRSLKIGTGRARIRALSNTLERAASWATSGFFRLVENKVKGDVSVWGAGMGAEREFVTIGPDDIKGHYEVYATLTPSLPNDESVDISNGLKLYQQGAIPLRDLLETYAGRENADELLRERFGEDVLKSPQAQQQMIAQALAQPTTNVTGGPLGVPGFVSGQLGLGTPQPSGPIAPTANPQSMAGVGAPRSIPTPPAAPGSLAESNNVIGRTQRAGMPIQPPAGAVQGIQRGPR